MRFAGQDLDGFVLERRSEAEHEGRLAPLRRVVSPEPVLVPSLLAAARATAQRCGDARRRPAARHPARHAAAEKALSLEAPSATGFPCCLPPPHGAGMPRGATLSHLTAGGAPAASWLAAPTTDPAAHLSGRGGTRRARGRPRLGHRRAGPP